MKAQQAEVDRHRDAIAERGAPRRRAARRARRSSSARRWRFRARRSASLFAQHLVGGLGLRGHRRRHAQAVRLRREQMDDGRRARTNDFAAIRRARRGARRRVSRACRKFARTALSIARRLLRRRRARRPGRGVRRRRPTPSAPRRAAAAEGLSAALSRATRGRRRSSPIADAVELLARQTPHDCAASVRHRARFSGARALGGPVGAVGVLVLAHDVAHVARAGAVAVHVVRVLEALVVHLPDRACRRVRVLARLAHLADAARERAHLEGVPRVVRALALLRPAGADGVRVLARAAAADRTRRGSSCSCGARARGGEA